MAVKTEVKSPIPNVTEKPRIGPEPMANMIKAMISVVMLLIMCVKNMVRSALARLLLLTDYLPKQCYVMLHVY